MEREHRESFMEAIQGWEAIGQKHSPDLATHEENSGK